MDREVKFPLTHLFALHQLWISDENRSPTESKQLGDYRISVPDHHMVCGFRTGVGSFGSSRPQVRAPPEDRPCGEFTLGLARDVAHLLSGQNAQPFAPRISRSASDSPTSRSREKDDVNRTVSRRDWVKILILPDLSVFGLVGKPDSMIDSCEGFPREGQSWV